MQLPKTSLANSSLLQSIVAGNIIRMCILLLHFIPQQNLKAQVRQLKTYETAAIKDLQIPYEKKESLITSHFGYSLMYEEKYEQAKWVAYQLSSCETRKLVERSTKFSIDQTIQSGSAGDQDYNGSGYDRGHLAPAADMSWNKRAMLESYYYSNISPQLPGFNRGIWKRLEDAVRHYAQKYDTVYIVTGPVFTDNMPVIGPNKVAVPQYFYKAALVYSSSAQQSIAFVIPNNTSHKSIYDYAVSIDSLESLTGIDFFYKLPDKLENYLESRINISFWQHQQTSKTHNRIRKVGMPLSVQCNGIIKKTGNQCQRKTKNANGYCSMHQSQSKFMDIR